MCTDTEALKKLGVRGTEHAGTVRRHVENKVSHLLKRGTHVLVDYNQYHDHDRSLYRCEVHEKHVRQKECTSLHFSPRFPFLVLKRTVRPQPFTVSIFAVQLGSEFSCGSGLQVFGSL